MKIIIAGFLVLSFVSMFVVAPAFGMGAVPGKGKTAKAQVEDWTVQYGNAGVDYAGGVSALYTPPTSEVFTVSHGIFNTPEQGFDIEVRKYLGDGSFDWYLQFGSNAILPSGMRNDYSSGVAVYSDGVYVAGYTQGFLPGETAAGNGFNHDVFLRKYSKNAPVELIFSDQFGTADNDYATGISIDPLGVCVVGTTNGDLAESNQGSFDIFIKRYDHAGNPLWTKQLGGEDEEAALGVSSISGGDNIGIYVVGNVYGTLLGQTSSGLIDAFIAKYDLIGNLQWIRQFGTIGDDFANRVSVDSSGIYVVGNVGGALPGKTAIGSYDAFIRKYDKDGNVDWTDQFGTLGVDIATGVSSSSLGIYVTGRTEGALPGQISQGENDAFVIEYNSAGTVNWIYQFGTPSNEVNMDVSQDQTGIYVAGETYGALNGSFGQNDIFIRKILDTAPPTTTTTSTTTTTTTTTTSTTTTTLPPTPEESIDELIEEVDDMGLQQDIEETLISKLESIKKALSSIEAGRGVKRKDTIKKLEAFIQYCEVQRGKELTDTQADDLIEAAEEIIAAL